MSVGLVYAKTAHRHMAEVLLGEIGRPPGPEMENSVDRESYSLAAGLALGFVTLGKGERLKSYWTMSCILTRCRSKQEFAVSRSAPIHYFVMTRFINSQNF